MSSLKPQKKKPALANELADSSLKTKLISFFSKHDQVLLPDSQIQKLGLLYSSYRFVVSVFLFMASYAALFQKQLGVAHLPSFTQQAVLLFYCLFSLLLLAFFFIAKKDFRRELLLGLVVDTSFVAVLLFINQVVNIQLVIMYIVVVFVSFMLLLSYQALLITLLAILSIMYTQSYQVLINQFNLASFGETLLLSSSLMGVASISWSISKRLASVERIAAENAYKNEQLHAINQEVISKMEQGILVLNSDYRIILSNEWTYKLLALDVQVDSKEDTAAGFRKKLKIAKTMLRNNKNKHNSKNTHLEKLLDQQHGNLVDRISEMPMNIKSEFLYHYSKDTVVEKIRLTTVPMQNGIILIMMEDLKREQTNAQQLKLASLGQLTASIAHEIRNPLAAISQASELLIEDANELKKQQKANDADDTNLAAHDIDMLKMQLEANAELYSMIFKQTKRVNRIIEDVLKLSRQAKPEQLRLPIVAWLKEFLNNHYVNQNVSFIENTFTSNSQIYVFFDPHQLEQILVNLINNGLRFSAKVNPQPCVEIIVICKNNNVMIDILDSGDGVAEDKLESLFMPFFTTDNDGTGLGLYLSQAFAEANFARLFYKPNHDKSCFCLLMANSK